jgi:DNA-binding response OmpR family regulator
VADSRCILVADDDADAAHALAALLQFEGHSATAAVGGQDALRHLEARDYDVAFLDAALPGRRDVESFLDLCARQARMRGYLMTGYSIGQLLGQTVKSSGVQIRRGPIGDESALAAVREAGADGIVLVASADPDAGETLQRVLAQSEYAVAYVTDASDARAHIEERRVHVLILDLGLRIIDAVGVYAALQAEGRAKPTFIVAGGDAAILDDAVMTGIITKPYDPARIIRQIERLAA